MRKMWLRAGNFVDMIVKYNPFGLKSQNGEPQFYETRYDNYLDVVKRLKEASPRGFLDVPLFLHENTGMPIDYCQRLVSENYKNGIEEEIFVVWDDGSAGEIWLKRILEMLHSISGTELDKEAYLQVVKSL